jgi:hypothetical protein
MQNLFRFAVVCIAGLSLASHSNALHAEDFDPLRFEKEVLVPACNDPMQLEIVDSQTLLFIERSGALKRTNLSTQKTDLLGTVPVAVYGEVGLLGLACDPNFTDSGLIYLFFCPSERPQTMRLSRFKTAENRLLLDSEVALLNYSVKDSPADLLEVVLAGCAHTTATLAAPDSLGRWTFSIDSGGTTWGEAWIERSWPSGSDGWQGMSEPG